LYFYPGIRLNLREMPRGLRACRMLDVSFLEFLVDTGQSDNGLKSVIPSRPRLKLPLDGARGVQLRNYCAGQYKRLLRIFVV